MTALYLDTSALIKLYVGEPGADGVRHAVARVRRIHAHWIGYVEMRSAFARLWRMGRQSEAAYRDNLRRFEADWRQIDTILPTEAVMRRAGELAERFALRGHDSLHLAAAETLGSAAPAGFLRFASFDQALNRAAAELGLTLLEI